MSINEALAETGLLFSEEEIYPYKAEWQNMPEYSHADLEPKFQVLVSFLTEQDLKDFLRIIGQENGLAIYKNKVSSLWHPQAEIGHFANLRYISPLR